MDAFNLHWPGGEATLHTDGVRCRVVWRAENGMGGAIDNTQLAKRRVASGLAFAPSLLDELRAKGYAVLADEFAALDAATPRPVPVKQATAPKPEPLEQAAAKSKPVAPVVNSDPHRGKPAVAPSKRTETTPTGRAKAASTSRIEVWLGSLGDAAFEPCGTRRAMKWHRGKTWPESLSLKPPGKTGAREWVVKIADGKTQYFVAAEFAGVCACLASNEAFASPQFFDDFFEGLKALRHKEVAAARDAWLENR